LLLRFILSFQNSEKKYNVTEPFGFEPFWLYRPVAGGSHLAEMWWFWGYFQYENLTGIIARQFPAG